MAPIVRPNDESVREGYMRNGGKAVKLFTRALKAFQCNNRIVKVQRKHLDDFLRGRVIGRLECGDVPSWKYPRNLESPRVSSPGLGNDSKMMRLDTCQNQISEQLLGTEDAVQEYLDDMEDAENYSDRYIEMCTRVDLKIRQTVVPTETEKRSFKLPKIELKKFSGEAKDFLAFWGQFQKIHNDKSIAEEDKMQYLLQSVEPKSKAERLVLSFPATAENYPKAIDQLKERFGREDLLVQST
ncbi:uncharacterized protein TNCV_1166011 [Trichonephila clavipes]|uniref:Uncharacterized protein n=1 Tax=Trichonephila clavipes TaxID=2585209 RepID=A0A8X6T8I5_TRICX|nr:uncharacterized protein TNCV_1166011 [Trichonephila clavipes]